MTRTFCNICGKEIKPSHEGEPHKLTFKFEDIDEHFCSIDCLCEGLEKWYARSPQKVTIVNVWSLAEANPDSEGEDKT